MINFGVCSFAQTLLAFIDRVHKVVVVAVLQLISVYFLVCKNADIHFQDRWKSTPLQDALEGNHLDCARVLHSFGGLLGESGDETLLELLDKPECPHIGEVWKKIRQLNDMVRIKCPCH